MIIGIIGKAGSGKDTVCDIIRYLTSPSLVENSRFDQCYKWEFNKSPWQRKAFADNLKKCCSIVTNTPLNNWHNQAMKDVFVTNGITYREFMQKFGTDALRRHFYDNIWIDSLLDTYSFDDKWIISDVRFLNEAEAIKKKKGILIKVDRGITDKMTHVSETELEGIGDIDYILYNIRDINELVQNTKTLLLDLGVIK